MRVPVPLIEIVEALERENYWEAANSLRRLRGWQARTLMCNLDERPSEVLGSQSDAVTKP
jgi:hypothetical protein